MLYAIRVVEPEFVEFFLQKGLDVNSKLNNGTTGLMWASEYGELDMVKLLIYYNCSVNIIKEKRKKDMTALDYATDIEIINLLRKHGAKTAKELKTEVFLK